MRIIKKLKLGLAIVIGLTSSVVAQPLIGITAVESAMSSTTKNVLLFAVVLGLIFASGFYRSPDYALRMLNFGLISAIMAIGVNMQWGYAGLFNIDIMGFVALGRRHKQPGQFPAGAAQSQQSRTARLIARSVAAQA